ncbi:hypothetical protein D3C86_1182490 [compost metagenome]
MTDRVGGQSKTRCVEGPSLSPPSIVTCQLKVVDQAVLPPRNRHWSERGIAPIVFAIKQTIGGGMPILSVVGVIVDRETAARLISELFYLHVLGLLTEWEEQFVEEMRSLPRNYLLSAKQAAKLLEILQDRRPRTHVEGINVLDMVRFFDQKRADLDDDDSDYVDGFLNSGRDYVQRSGVDRICAIARRLEEDFPSVRWHEFHLHRDELAQITRLAREELRIARRKRRKLQAVKPKLQVVLGRRGCGNDLSPLLASLAAFERAVSG